MHHHVPLVGYVFIVLRCCSLDYKGFEEPEVERLLVLHDPTLNKPPLHTALQSIHKLLLPCLKIQRELLCCNTAYGQNTFSPVEITA